MTAQATATGAEEIAWDLTDLFGGVDDPKLKEEIERAVASARRFREKYHGKVADLSARELYEAVAELEDLESSVYRAFAYARLEFSVDTSDPPRGALLQLMQEKATVLETELLFFQLEWVAVDDKQAEKLIGDPVLERYRHYLEAARRYRPYVLSEPEEKVLSEKRVSGVSAWGRLFTELVSSLKVELDGRVISLEEALSKLQQPDRELRKKAAEAITKTLRAGLRTHTFIFNTVLLDKSTDDRLRGYKHWLASRNLSNEISDESVQALVDACVGRYDIPQRYYALKAKLLGLDKIADYDRLAPVASTTTPISWDEAREVVVNSYTKFSPDVGGIINEFFERRWIDAPVRDSKEAGAFCFTTIPGAHPYVLMNFTGERRSILTLAHELGHGLHGYLAQDKGLFNADTPLTLAETASVFGEALTFKKLLAEESVPEKRLDLLTGRIDDTIATVFRQIAMNRFEDGIHNKRRREGELSAEIFAEVWQETQATMLGPAVEITDGYRSWWSYIHHFVNAPGYVYAYAFGYLFSLAIFQKYEKEGDSMVRPYLDLLRAGGSDKPEVLAKIVGLDITDPGFWGLALEGIDALLKEAEELAAEVRS